jgi:tetratricopeptide (TPR) repeat protein
MEAGVPAFWILGLLLVGEAALIGGLSPLWKAARWRQQGKRERAVAMLERYVARRDPLAAMFRANARLWLGALQYELGNPEAAQAAVAPLWEGRAARKWQRQVHALESLVALERDDLAGARQHLEQAPDTKLVSGFPLTGYRAWVAYLSDELDEAERLVSSITTQITYETPMAISILSFVNWARGDFDQALAGLDEAERQARVMARRLVTSSGTVQGWQAVTALNRGFIYLEREEWDAASEAILTALQCEALSPGSSAMAYAGLGLTYAAAGDYAEAEETFSTAEGILADLSAAKMARTFLQSCRAAAARLRGDWPAVVQWLQETLALPPFPVSLPSLYYHLGEAHESLGEWAEAQRSYQSAVDTGSSQIWVQRAAERLAEGEKERLTEEAPAEVVLLQRR